MTRLAAAEALFGSVSRGDDDPLSDRDILLVDDDKHLLNRRRATLEAEGASVASYTFKRLDSLVAKGALFIMHLKNEAIILRDIDGRLGSTLSGFCPKTSYEKELMQNAQLAQLAAVWPNIPAGALWAADVLYVATRNFGVLYLAQKGIYLFSYARLLETLVDEGVIKPDAVNHLRKLRWAKSIYRSGEYTSVRSAVANDTLQRAVEARPDASFPQRSIGLSPADLLMGSVELPAGMPAYHRLRNMERSYLALRALDPALVASKDLNTLSRWIEDPRSYAYFASKSEREIITEMRAACGSLFMANPVDNGLGRAFPTAVRHDASTPVIRA